MPRSSAVLCPICGHLGKLGKGPGGRPGAACVQCGSLERHRGLVGIVAGLREAAREGTLVDVAPSTLTSKRLATLAADLGVPYVGMDFDPAADARTVDVQASLTSIPLADASVGLLVCFHVLEHIPDDRAAMTEISRVLAGSGLALIQVPARPGVPTDEDPSADVHERVARFGQSDHVRYYGLEDFEARLTAAGLKVQRLAMGDLYDELACDLLGIVRDEPVWVCSTGATVEASAIARCCSETAREAVSHMTVSLLAERDTAHARADRATRRSGRLRARLAKAKRARDKAIRRERQLRGRAEVRVGSVLRRWFGAVRRRR